MQGDSERDINLPKHLNPSDLAKLAGIRHSVIKELTRNQVLMETPAVEGKEPMFSETEIVVAQIVAPLTLGQTIVPVLKLVAQDIRYAIRADLNEDDGGIRDAIAAALDDEDAWLLIETYTGENDAPAVQVAAIRPGGKRDRNDLRRAIQRYLNGIGAYGTVTIVNLTAALKRAQG